MQRILDYTGPFNEPYSCYCGAQLELPALEGGGDYILVNAKYIRFDRSSMITPGLNPLVTLFQQPGQMVTRSEFYDSTVAVLSGIFSAMPWWLPEGLLEAAAPKIRSYLRHVAEGSAAASMISAVHFFICGPPIYTTIVEEDGDEDEDEDDEVDQAVRESAAEIRMVPASRAAIEALEEVEIRGDDCDYKCTVCFEEMKLKLSDTTTASPDHRRRIVRMPCSHLYHKDCIVPWLEESHLCPLCRYAMPTSS